MIKNIFILLLCCLNSFFSYCYIESRVTIIQNQSDSGQKIQASNSDLRGAQLINLKGDNGNFMQVKAQPCEQEDDDVNPGICIAGQTTNMSNGSFISADFTNSTFRHVDFAGSNFTNAIAYNADFSGSYFYKANLTGIQLVSSDIALKMLNISSDETSSLTTAADLAAADPSDVAQLTATSFCNATMPDGQICDDALSLWTDTSSGQIISCGCNLSTGVDDSV
jgi:uncharacterized protein YjbI with pentapeptide repeats